MTDTFFEKFTRCAKVCAYFFLIVLFFFWMLIGWADKLRSHDQEKRKNRLVLHVTQLWWVLLCSVPTLTLKLTVQHIIMSDRVT